MTFVVAPGECVTLLGRPGAGKTLLLRLIAGFVEPDEGQIRIDGAPVADVPPARRDCVLVPAGLALWPHLSVFEHVAFPLRARRLSPGETAAGVKAALARLGLEGFEARRPGELSEVRRARLALARALAANPRALLLDEPLASLAPGERTEITEDLRRLHRELALTMMCAAARADETLSLATRVAVLERGAIIQVGVPEELYCRPRSRVVAELLGPANLLRGQLESTAQGWHVRLEGGLALMIPPLDALAGDSVLCVIRPEAVRAPAADGRGPTRFIATVTAARYVAGRWECELTLAGGQALRATVPMLAGVALPREGEQIPVVIAPEDILILPG